MLYGTVKFVLDVGLLIRREVVKEIKNFCFMHNLECTVVEEKGLLESNYQFKVTGKAKDINVFTRWLEMFIEANV